MDIPIENERFCWRYIKGSLIFAHLRQPPLFFLWIRTSKIQYLKQTKLQRSTDYATGAATLLFYFLTRLDRWSSDPRLRSSDNQDNCFRFQDLQYLKQSKPFRRYGAVLDVLQVMPPLQWHYFAVFWLDSTGGHLILVSDLQIIKVIASDFRIFTISKTIKTF